MLDSGTVQFLTRIAPLLSTAAWQAYDNNHGDCGVPYSINEAIEAGVKAINSRSYEDARDFGNVLGTHTINTVLCAIDDLARNGDEAGSHDGSTYGARRDAAKKIIEWLTANGIRRGVDAYERASAGSVRKGGPQYVLVHQSDRWQITA